MKKAEIIKEPIPYKSCIVAEDNALVLYFADSTKLRVGMYWEHPEKGTCKLTGFTSQEQEDGQMVHFMHLLPVPATKPIPAGKITAVPFSVLTEDSSSLTLQKIVIEHDVKVGSCWKHNKRGGVYKVTGFSWDGDRDLWVIHLIPVLGYNTHSVPCSRSAVNFLTPEKFSRVDYRP